MPEVSIIVPVYRVEPYLRKCVDSILTQTLTDLELILIDDGSPDNCGAICDEYARQDARVLVIHQQNAGVSAARNAGLDAARGDYIGFVDSDDWIEPEMYATMLRTAKESGADVVVCGVRFCGTDGSTSYTAHTASESYTGDTLVGELFHCPCRIGGGIWNKIFRASTVKKLHFPESRKIGEDWVFLFYALQACRTGIQIPHILYNILERPGSATREGNVVQLCDAIIGSKLLLLLLCREHTPQLEGAAIDKYLDDCLRYVPQIRAAGRSYHQPYRATVWKIRGLMLREMARAARRRLLSRAKLRGYLYAWIRL